MKPLQWINRISLVISILWLLFALIYLPEMTLGNSKELFVQTLSKTSVSVEVQEAVNIFLRRLNYSELVKKTVVGDVLLVSVVFVILNLINRYYLKKLLKNSQ